MPVQLKKAKTKPKAKAVAEGGIGLLEDQEEEEIGGGEKDDVWDPLKDP